jgi:hypothetical protein
VDAAQKLLGEIDGMAVNDLDSTSEETPPAGGGADLREAGQPTEGSDGRAGENLEGEAPEAG